MKRRGGNDVRAVRREVMGWCVRPTLGHANFPSRLLVSGKLLTTKKSDAKTHRTPKALRAKFVRPLLFVVLFSFVEENSTASPPHAD
jgi:hypothetical protein